MRESQPFDALAQGQCRTHQKLSQRLGRAHGALVLISHCVYMQSLSLPMDIMMQVEKFSEFNSLHDASRLDSDQLNISAGELGLYQVRSLLLQPDLVADRVAEPGTPAFDYGLTHSDLLMHSLRAAQIPQLAA